MSNKKRSKEGIESIERQIEEHGKKLHLAEADDDIGLSGYYRKEIQHLEEAKNRLEKRVKPKKKRKK